jgi:hypothetical protein
MTETPGKAASEQTSPRYRVVLLVGLALLLAVGCSRSVPTHNKDPRQGRVYTYWTCPTFDACRSDWKVCLGPDLLMSLYDDKGTHTVKDSSECRPR